MVSFTMASTEQPQPLIFQIEDEKVASSQPPAAAAQDAAIRSIMRLKRTQTTYERQIQKDVASFLRMVRDSGSKADVVGLACSLSSLGHRVTIRQAVGGGEQCFKNLFHEFLIVKGAGDSKGTDIVVECAFDSHFRIPCATSAYQELLAHLPEVFIGPLQRMLPLVDLMTQELSRSFDSAGITMPPWRSARAVMSKWAPQKATDRLPDEVGASSSTGKGQLYGQPAPASGISHAAQVHAAAHADSGRNDAGALGQQHVRSGAQTRQVKQPYKQKSGGGSPVAKVKLGFDSPQSLGCPTQATTAHSS